MYSILAITVIVGLWHAPHVYLYSSAALRNLGSDVEAAARVAGARPFRVALDVSLPMTLPALLFAGVLVFFLGFEVFGLPLVLGDPEGHLVLATYLYKLTQQARRAVASPDGRGRRVHFLSRLRFRSCCCKRSASSLSARTASSP